MDDFFEKLWELLFRLFGIFIIASLLYATFISKVYLWVVVFATPFFILSGYMGYSYSADFKDD